MHYALVWLQPLLALVGLALAVKALRGRSMRTWARIQAAGATASSVGLALYVAGEDHYRNDGTSRWEAYDAQALTIAAIAAGAAAAALLIAAAARDRRRLGGVASLLSVGAAALTFAAYFANTLN